MAVLDTWLTIEEQRLVPALQQASEKLDSAAGEIVLDFSSVLRVDPAAIQAIERFADTADRKAVKVALRGVNVDIYKVLKLVKLASRLSFVA